jgi:transposase
MSFGQLTHRESLSDTALCLRLQKEKLYHLGIGYPFHKSTISRANETRDWRIFRDFALKLIEQAKILYKDVNQLDIKLKGSIYALDSTVVDLCLSVFWWATFRTTKSAIKIHTLLDLKTSIPEYIFITEGSVHDVNILDNIDLPRGSYLVMDRAYIDFERLWDLASNRINFVIRAKTNLKYNVLDSGQPDKDKGILSDQCIRLTSINSTQRYPDCLRRVRYYDVETQRTFVFLTNNFKLTAMNIAALYKSRWGIETFFKWIKQHLKIQSFWGQSENAVKTHIWIAISSYLIVIIAKKKLNLKYSLYEILQMIRLAPFDRTPMKKLFENAEYQNVKEQIYDQLKLF